MIRHLLILTSSLVISGCGEVDPAPREVTTGTSWTTPDCEFAITFPEEPKEVEREVPGMGPFVSAEAAVGNGVYRSECVTLTPKLRNALGGDTRTIIKTALTENARRSGIDPVTVEMTNSEGGVVGRARGNKQVNGVEATYETAITVGDRSLISAVIAAPATEFPAEGQMAFLKSLHRK